jgi:hypothetical protein
MTFPHNSYFGILNLCTRRRWVVNYMSLVLYPWQKNSGTHWKGGLLGPRIGLDNSGEQKNLLPPAWFVTMTAQPQASQ